MTEQKIGWARPAGKWHIFASDEEVRGRVSVCHSVALGCTQNLTNGPTTNTKICPSCVAWNKARQAGRQ